MSGLVEILKFWSWGTGEIYKQFWQNLADRTI